MTRLGLLEYFDQTDRRSVAAKRTRSFEAAMFAEARNCSRVLVAEHHGLLSPSASPFQYASVLASHTSRIRVGTAVSLLRIRNTYLTTVEIATLVGLAGDRVDVGLGRGDFRGPGSDLVDGTRKTDDELEEAFVELRRLLVNGGDALPPADDPPQFWMHGASPVSGHTAARLQMNYCFGLFLRDDLDAANDAFAAYRRCGSGLTALAVSVVANRSPAVAGADAAGVRDASVNLVGGLEECGESVARLVELTGVDEVLLVELSSEVNDHLAAVDWVAKALE